MLPIQAQRTFSRTCNFTKRYLATAAPSKIRVGILLKRNPVILRKLTEFEHAYYTYRESLEQAESRPFHREFYFKKGSTAEQRWLDAQDAAATAAERLEGGRTPLVQPRDEELAGLETAERVTEADKGGDVKSLDRALERTLYLVVKKADNGSWEFPAGPLEGEEVLHEGATRHLHSEVGSSLETWVVGRTPVGHLSAQDKKTFYMKAHILSGKIEPNKRFTQDFAWLTKQELKEYLQPAYYEQVHKMLAEF
ncbi:hypothetical protein SpCBS45565_g01488 [Spizellomyces sp. 'palustris']|nr:hypothetical protein SpCBS45565_g01488 [Spizellomyces sp. 'palustris']